MKKIRSLVMMAAAVSTMIIAMVFSVSADEATDLSEMKVYGVNASGNKTEVPMSFNATTYEYDLTVKSDVTSIEIEAETKDSASKWVIEKDGINTKMDTGMNKTIVAVTSRAGAVQKYTLNTKKLTAAEEATYKEPETEENDTIKNTASETTVKVGKSKMKIISSFGNDKIPEGFKKSTQKYKDKKYTAIKGEVKDITAFYLYGKDKEGFYIYDKDKDTFYTMSNIKIKSRMYTIVQPEETDGIVEAYKKKKVTIIDQKVKAWALDEEEGMYLVYAMNWNGDTNLYCYDDNEKCFQRYLTSSDANKQSEAAAKAYNKLQKDYNKLVDKYNVLIKILCAFVILIIILIFVLINLVLNKKEKKIKNDNQYSLDDKNDEKLSKADKKAAKKEAKKAKKNQKYVQDDDDIDSGIAIEQDGEKDFKDDLEKGIQEDLSKIGDEIEAEISEDISEDDVSPIVDLQDVEKEVSAEEKSISEDIENEVEKIPKRGILGRAPKAVPYGDEPTFGTDKQSEEGFYGGEVDEEDEVFIDIVEDDDKDDIEDVANDTEVSESADYDDDLKETMKSLLPDEQDDDDDDDFQFIDLD
ncbi:MAG: cadherin-like beta sandwich domain-containing protein [Eubacterium sp.]|nr:cadherin-like beta sandwich domain-containing protein [Eubacterium sp.]